MRETAESGFIGSLRFKYGLGLLALLALAGFFLWDEYGALIVGYLPIILVLGLCGGMHFFMHRGHGGGHGSHHDDSGKDNR